MDDWFSHDIAYTLICTGRYRELFHGFYESFVRYIPEGRLIVFTDDPSYFRSYVRCRFVKVHHVVWPYAVMNGYRMLLEHAREFDGFRRIVKLQANMRFLRRPDFGIGPVTLCYHPYSGESKRYVCGGLTCGDREPYLVMARWVQDWLDAHPSAPCHDETALNAWWNGVCPDCEVLPDWTIYPEESPGMRRPDTCIVVVNKAWFFGCAKHVYAGSPKPPAPQRQTGNTLPGPAGLLDRVPAEGAVALGGRLGNQLWQISAGLVRYGEEGLSVAPPSGSMDLDAYRQCLHGLRETRHPVRFGSYFQHRKWLASPSAILRHLRTPADIPSYGNILHLRLGDYVRLQGFRDRVMTVEDITGYMDLLGLSPGDVTVMSDSPAQEVLSHLPPGEWNIAPQLDTLQAFWAMMKCRKLICSASTFSYWAAYLKQCHPDDFVVHPVWGSEASKGRGADMYRSFHDLMFWAD